MKALAVALVCAAGTAHADVDLGHGLSLGGDYVAEGWATTRGDTAALGHVDLSATLDTHAAGLPNDGQIYVLAQNNHGDALNDIVGSATQISNLEAAPYTQITELFVEQHAGPVVVRVGKQDANRDFGTPRFGGNFINNNFGMFPTAPLPSYPTTDLGAMAGVTAGDFTARAAAYDGDPGRIYAGVVAGTVHFNERDNGTTSIGGFEQSGTAGFFVQTDERFFTHRAADDPTGVTAIFRFAWTQADKTQISRYGGGSIAYHGLGSRHDDTVGVGAGTFTVDHDYEWFVETFYKWRINEHASVQPDVEVYAHPSGDRASVLIAGVRVKVKL